VPHWSTPLPALLLPQRISHQSAEPSTTFPHIIASTIICAQEASDFEAAGVKWLLLLWHLPYHDSGSCLVRIPFCSSNQFSLTPRPFLFTLRMTQSPYAPPFRLWTRSLQPAISTNEFGTEKILCSGRQRSLRLSLLAITSYQRLRCDFGVEEWIPTCGTIWDILQVSRSSRGKLPSGRQLTCRCRSIRFGNERFKPRHGKHYRAH
jgi:hypothetical protein